MTKINDFCNVRKTKNENITIDNISCKLTDFPPSFPASSLDDVILTPYKYNGGQLYQQDTYTSKLLITVDWFECSALGEFLEFDDVKIIEPKSVIACSDDVYLARDEARVNGTKHFKYFYKVYLHGELFGTVRTCPRSSILDPDLSMFKIENYILYQRGWLVRFNYILGEMGVKAHNVSRLDIAVDGAGFMDDYQKILSGEYKKVGRAKMATHHEPSGKVEGFYIGSRSSPKLIRCYDKTKELKENLGKGYISQWWDDNSFFVGDKVERLELTIKSKGLRYIKDFDYGELENPSYLAGVMKSVFNKFYQFIPTENEDSNVSRVEKIEAIEWSYFDCMKVDKQPKTNKPSVIWAVQQTISFLMRESYAGLEFQGVDLWDNAYKKCFDYAVKYGIVDWFKSKLPKWRKEKKYHDLMRKEVAYAKEVRFRKGTNSKVFTGS